MMNDGTLAPARGSTLTGPDTRGSGIRRAKTPRDGESFRGTTRFQPRALLGQGGMGVVYRVHDVEMGVDVALKTLPAMNPAEIVHIKNEFRVLLGLDHPNLIELHELIVAGDEAFFTMELLDGGSFVAHVQGREVRDSPAPGELRGAWLDRLGVSLGQLVQGLTYLHHRGKLHCDIKPSNVQVTSTGRVVLLDFGLATAILADGEQNFGHGDMLGTVEYMAPEQAWGTELTPAADWYAVGSMLYEALTGMLPFRGELEEIVTNKTRVRPAPPCKVNPAIPKALSDLVLALLEPAPEKRASGKSILEFISSISGTAVEFDTEMVGRDAPFVGREAEMAELHALHQKTRREQRPRVVRVEGPSGMGKSELVRRFIADLERKTSAVVLRGRCHPRESVAYKAFDGVIDALGNYLATLSSRELPVLAPPHTHALLRVFHALSVLQDLSPTPAIADPPEPQELRRRAFEGLALLLESISQRSSVVIWIDDLQWGDVDSLSLLHELLVSMRGPVLFIIGYRAEEVERNSILQSLERITKVLPAEAATHLRLGPLQEVSARALAASVLGRRADVNVLNDIAAEAAGSPFFLAELARYAARRAGNDLESQELRPRFVDVIRARIERLGPDERRLLEISSIAGGPLDRSVALKVAGLGERGRPHAARLGQACLLRNTEIEGRPAIETYHDRIREALLAQLSAQESQTCHLSLAHALKEQPGTDPETLFRHYLGGGDSQEAGRFAILAAERADGALAFDRAAELYQKALDLESNVLPAWKIRERLAEALTHAGRGVEAAHGFRVAAEAATRATEAHAVALNLERRSAEQFLRSGYNDQGMAMMRAVLARVGVEVPTSPSKAMRNVAAARVRLLVRGMSFTPQTPDAVPREVLERLDALWGFSTSISMMNHTVADVLGVWHLLEALHWGERSRVARALGYEASFEAALGGHWFRKRSEDMLATVVKIARETAIPYDEAWSHMAIGTSAWLGAQWARTVWHCDRGQTIFRQHCRGVTWELAIMDLYALSALSQLGQMRELGRRLPRALREAEAHGDLFAANNVRVGQMSVLWLALDEPEQALRLAREAEQSWRADHYHTQKYHHIIGLTQTNLYLGRVREAYDRFEEEWPKLEAAQFLMLETPRVELWHLRARTALAVLAQRATRDAKDSSRLRKLCIEASRRIEKATVPTAKPFAALIRAGLARLEGNTRQTETELRSAIKLFDHAHMAMYREAARYCLSEILPGETGRMHAGACRSWMAHEEIRRPEPLVDMLVPACRKEPA